MLVIPAVDLMDGKCVRLVKGDPRQLKVYFNNPLEPAKLFETQGAETLHLIDLDAALGLGQNFEMIEKMSKNLCLNLQIGGGIRTFERAETLINLGASRIKTLMSITVPLIMPGLVAGAVLTFINCFTEVSTSLMLQPIIGPFGLYARPLSLQILLESKGGPTAIKVASCLGFIQIIATSIGLYLTNKLLGGKAGLAFGG